MRIVCNAVEFILDHTDQQQMLKWKKNEYIRSANWFIRSERMSALSVCMPNTRYPTTNTITHTYTYRQHIRFQHVTNFLDHRQLLPVCTRNSRFLVTNFCDYYHCRCSSTFVKHSPEWQRRDTQIDISAGWWVLVVVVSKLLHTDKMSFRNRLYERGKSIEREREIGVRELVFTIEHISE